MPVYSDEDLGDQLDETLRTERLIAMLSAAFGVLATMLAAIGLYGVMAFVVARRTKEIGLRMALGARRSEVVWMVLRESMLLVGIGLAAGVPASFLLNRYVSSQLYSVQPTDIWTAAGGVGNSLGGGRGSRSAAGTPGKHDRPDYCATVRVIRGAGGRATGFRGTIVKNIFAVFPIFPETAPQYT